MGRRLLLCGGGLLMLALGSPAADRGSGSAYAQVPGTGGINPTPILPGTGGVTTTYPTAGGTIGGVGGVGGIGGSGGTFSTSTSLDVGTGGTGTGGTTTILNPATTGLGTGGTVGVSPLPNTIGTGGRPGGLVPPRPGDPLAPP